MSSALPDAAGFVLAGGRSSRMNTEKALVTFEGRPLLAHALQNLRDAGLEPTIAGARCDLSQFAPVIADAEPDLGPLGGICAALASTSAEWSVFLSVDLPLLPASLVAYLLSHARITCAPATIVSVNGVAQTFPAVIHRGTLPVLRAEMQARRRGCFAGYQTAARVLARPIAILPAEFLTQAGHVAHPLGLPPARWFLNLNTPSDLEHAMERRAAHPIA